MKPKLVTFDINEPLCNECRYQERSCAKEPCSQCSPYTFKFEKKRGRKPKKS